MPCVKILEGNCLDTLKTLNANSINTVVTSPPYYNLRDYNGEEEQIGLEETPQEYIQSMVNVFKEIKRVLRDDGTVWLNIGDTYHNKELLMIPHRLAIALADDGWLIRQDIIWAKGNPMPESVRDRCTKAHEYIFLITKNRKYYFDADAIKEPTVSEYKPSKRKSSKTKYGTIENESKHRQGMHSDRGSNLIEYRPHLPPQQEFVDFIRQTPKKDLYNNTEIKKSTIDHWYRSDSSGFAYPSLEDWNTIYPHLKGDKATYNTLLTTVETKTDEIVFTNKKNKRSVWNVNPKPFKDAHFAVYPVELIEPCILAGCPEKICVSCDTPYKKGATIDRNLTLEEVEEIKNNLVSSVDDKEKKPYAIIEKEFRNQVIEYRDLPPHNILKEYLKEYRNKSNLTIQQIEDHFGTQAPHHWFETGGSYPTVEDWKTLKSLLSLDDTYDEAMTTVFYKSGLKGDHTYVATAFTKQCRCDTDDTRSGIVLDPFGGSGTTAIAAYQNNCDTILCELSSEYIEIAIKRLKSHGIEVE